MKPSDKSVDLVEELKLLLNFTYELIELDDEDQDIFGSVRKIYVGDENFSKLSAISRDGINNVEFKDVHSNGTFSGMTGMLQKGEADVILADIPITSGIDIRQKKYRSKNIGKPICNLVIDRGSSG